MIFECTKFEQTKQQLTVNLKQERSGVDIAALQVAFSKGSQPFEFEPGELYEITFTKQVKQPLS